jgi:predicted Zn-dependent protease
MTENEVPAQRLSYKHFSSTNPLKVRISSELWQKQYVSSLGDSLIPAGAKGTKRPIEFRFFVVEDPEINAASLPDGTLLINTVYWVPSRTKPSSHLY